MPRANVQLLRGTPLIRADDATHLQALGFPLLIEQTPRIGATAFVSRHDGVA